MDEELMATFRDLSDAYENLSQAFIKYSLAYNRITQLVHDREDNHPRLFTD